MLSTTIGDNCYDPTLKRTPAAVLGLKPRKNYKSFSPGPKYDISGFGPKGKLETPAFYFGVKPKDRSK